MVLIMIRMKIDVIFYCLFCDGAGDEMVGPCVGLGVGEIMSYSNIYDVQLN